MIMIIMMVIGGHFSFKQLGVFRKWKGKPRIEWILVVGSLKTDVRRSY